MNSLNQPLLDELLAMRDKDQQVLQSLIDTGELGDKEYHPAMKAIHEAHNARIKAIVAEHGWPGISLVGEEGSGAAWLLVQHAVLDRDFMQQCLALLREAVALGEAEGWCLAYLEDRVHTMAGELQIYGTQHDIDETGTAYPLPMVDPDGIDLRRKEVGLDTLSEATKRIQDRYDLTVTNRTASQDKQSNPST